MSEYVKVKAPEITYGATNLLQSQISLITTLQHYQEYKKLRKDELSAKIDFKNKIEKLKELLDNLSRALPESKFLEEKKEKEKLEKEISLNFSKEKPIKQKKQEKAKSDNAALSLDEELEEIRKKLEKLKWVNKTNNNSYVHIEEFISIVPV